MDAPDLSRYAWLSLTAGVATMTLKFWASAVTGSVGLYSDALETLVNVLAASLALWALKVAQRPPDSDHAFGHEKVEYFAGGFEGALILMASGGIAWAAVPRLLAPRPLEQIGEGAFLSLLATAINGSVALILLRAGKRHRSITLEGDARHLLADVWSGLAVLVGILVSSLGRLPILDPLVALGIAAYVASTGVSLLRRSALGLLDVSLDPDQVAAIEAILGSRRDDGVTFHALRTRRAGRFNFIQAHVLVPGEWTVTRGHALLEEWETRIRQAIPGARVLTHLEPVDDPCSFADIPLDRD